MSLALSSGSKQRLRGFQTGLPHAILLTGDAGVGLATAAKELAGKRLAAFIEPLNNKDGIDHETGTISVEIIRRLYDQTRAKQTERQVFILDDADRMSNAAQAAFLKLLEEPTASTHFILTSHSPQLLLPTVRSRVQAVTIEPLTIEQTKDFITDLGIVDTKTALQLEFLATGLPAELTRLTADNDYFKQRAEVMADTRSFLTSPTYQRLLIVQKYQKDRASALRLLDSALAVTRRSLRDKPQTRLVTQLERLLTAREKVEANCNIRLQLTAFVVQ